jgi:hypothetical protein
MDFDNAAKSSGVVKDFASVKSTAAAPAACSGDDPSSFANPLTSSGLALAATDSASTSEGGRRSTCARALVADENDTTIAHAATHAIRGVWYVAITASFGGSARACILAPIAHLGPPIPAVP